MVRPLDREAIHRELEAFGRANMRSDHIEYMEGHMVRLFEEALSFKPKLIVELGVGSGCSNLALGKAAELCRSAMVAVDVKQCDVYRGVVFIKADDLEYAKAWKRTQCIDLLMIDTGHTYGQTKAEVEAWWPHLCQRAKVIFHDTNAKPYYEAVARFLRDWLEIPFPEGEAFEAKSGDWTVRHYPESWGLTIMDRGVKDASVR